ncbi:cytochrome P450 [Microbacterium trichothecenolyticum]|nr:cytochrome P450 [Microbacterium trichothecenolyticum]
MDPAWYAKSDWHATYRMLRTEDPVHWTEDRAYGHPYWAISDFAGIQDVFDRFEDFSSRMGTVPPRNARRLTPEERSMRGHDVRVPNLDPPVHGLYRRPINKHFSVPAVSKLTAHIDRVIDDLISEVAAKDEFDFVQDVASQLPMRVIFGMLGVPEEDWPSLHNSIQRYAHSSDPAYTVDNDPIATWKAAASEIDTYAANLALARREQPQDDMATVIGSLRIDGDVLSLHEMQSWFSTLITGGGTPTRAAMGTGVLQFIRDPAQRMLLLDNEAIAADAVEEVLRWGSPSRLILRVVNRDLEFRGKDLAAGDWIMLMLASGNRDEKVWRDADRFDIGRERIDHLGLGHGIHKCLGRNLVRLELSHFFPRFLRAFPQLSLTAEPEWIADYNNNGLHSLHLSHHGDVRL